MNAGGVAEKQGTVPEVHSTYGKNIIFFFFLYCGGPGNGEAENTIKNTKVVTKSGKNRKWTRDRWQENVLLRRSVELTLVLIEHRVSGSEKRGRGEMERDVERGMR